MPKANNGPVQDAPYDYQDMLMNAPIGIFISTPAVRFVYANLALARIFGYDSPRELIDATGDISSICVGVECLLHHSKCHYCYRAFAGKCIE